MPDSSAMYFTPTGAASAPVDEVEILPIGSGGEVGRSCVVVRYKGRSVMLDCGNHPAKSGLDSLPFFDSINCGEIDLVLITHFHLDHCGALPYFWYWEAHKELQHIPIYYASSLAQRCMKLYQTFVSAMNDRVKQQHANHRNPFVFKYIQPLVDTRSFEDNGPCVVLASPGMLQSGISLELFEKWCGDRRNGIIIAGYCIDGTIAKDVLSKPREITKPDGKVLPLRMRTIQSVSFSAHSDGRQTRDFIQALPKTQHVILVHGNAGAMIQLKNKLQQDFADRGVKVYATKNQEAIRIPFSVQRTAKVLGSLASNPPRDGEFVSGVLLVSGQHSYSIVHPTDIPNFTDLDVAQIQQAIVMPFPRYKSPLEVLEVLQRYFEQSRMFSDVAPCEQQYGEDENSAGAAAKARDPEPSGNTTRIGVTNDVWVDVQQSTKSQTTATINWVSSHRNDLVADVTCIALTKLMREEHTAEDADALPVDVCGNDRLFRLKCFHHMMAQFYSAVTTNLGTGVCTVELENGQEAIITDCIEIDLPNSTKANYSSSAVERLRTVLKRVYLTLFPIPVDQGWCDCGMIHGAEPTSTVDAM
uniref:Putative cleavage and polyadenylation specificity factor n=1 Tax=Trypanosoma vivax (strain Y486) TaxID=1055687 RepID=G0TU04_TRYVY|nr:putative cleavage and polyadenylation specificity factor, fragment [Trypanosoma vivax Y486]